MLTKMARNAWIIIAIAFSAAAADKVDDIDPNLRARVAAIFKQLESDDFHVRDAASAAIDALPAETLPLIEEALATGELSPEVSLRLEAKISSLRRKATSSAYEKALAQNLVWARTNTLAAYDEGRHKNPKWDAAAHEAIVLSIRPAFDPNLSTKDDARIDDAFRKAIDLGCDDPLILYMQANRYRVAAGHDPDRSLQMFDRPVTAILAEDYSPWRKMMAAARRAQARCATDPGKLAPDVQTQIRSDLDLALGLLPQAAKDGTPRDFILDGAGIIFFGYARLMEFDNALKK
jgi:hypothetical protein